MRVAIIGGGLAGLTAAYDLAKAGHAVDVYEAQAELGGQAGTFAVGGTRLERFYHHIFTSDTHIVDLIDELGLGPRMLWIPSKVGWFYGGRTYDFVTPMDLLRFSPLGILDRLRAGVVSLYLQRQPDGMRYEQTSAADWIRRYAGNQVFRVIWGPLLRGKFGARAEDVSMTWFWGKMRLRFGSRKGLVRESLGYVAGSFQLLIDALADQVRSKGGRILTNSAVEEVIVHNGRATGLRVAGAVPSTDGLDAVIATVPSFRFLDLVPQMPGQYASLLRKIDYQAAVVLVLQIADSLSRIYWLNVSDPQVPFVAAIEHTNFIGPEAYGGRRLLYLSNYVDRSSPLFTMPKESLVESYLPGLQRINPAFSAGSIQESWLFRDPAGQPVVTRGYSKLIPPHATPISGLYLANTTQIYPEDRGMNYSVRLGHDIARVVQNGS